MLFLDREDSERDISLYINSPGGEISAGMAIYDTMQLIQAPVSTISVGITASMATILLTAGTKGRRYALPHATVHLHQPLGGVQGQAADIEIAAREILRMRDLLNKILLKHTGLAQDKIDEITPEKRKGSSHETSFRVIADHIKAAVFILGDERGVVPSNLEQGYILRRYIRRVIRHLRLLGADLENMDTTVELAKVVIDIYKEDYPMLLEKEEFICSELKKEED